METAGSNRGHDNNLFVWLGAFFALVALGVTSSVYFIPLLQGRYSGTPVQQLYTLLLLLWPLFFLVQAVFAANGSSRNHRSFGMAGISLATALEFAGCAALITALENSRDAGMDARGLGSTASGFVGLLMFMVFFAWAIVRRRRIDVHKRMQLLAMLALMQQLVSEVTVVPVISTSLLLSALVLVVVCVRDLYLRRRVHPVYLTGGMVLLVVQGLPYLWVDSALWRGIIAAVMVFGQ